MGIQSRFLDQMDDAFFCGNRIKRASGLGAGGKTVRRVQTEKLSVPKAIALGG